MESLKSIDEMLAALQSSEAVAFRRDARKFIEAASKISIEDAKAGKLKGLVYDPSSLSASTVASWRGDRIIVNNSFFDGDRLPLLWHEFGHAVTHLAFASFKDETAEVLRPFRNSPTNPWSYYNFAGLSERPDEMIADVYADLMTAKRKPWEDEDGRIAQMYKFVLRVAKKASLPVPTWHSGAI